MKIKDETKKAEKKTFGAKQVLEFKPDWDKKSDVAAYLVESRKNLRAAIFIAKVLLISGVVVGAGYILLHLAINAWNISFVSGAPATDYATVVLTGLLYFGVGALISWVIRATASTMTGRYIKDRSCEKIEFDGNIFRFTYEHTSRPWRKTVIEVPLGEPEACPVHMTYEPKTAKIVFKCDMRVNEVNTNRKPGKKVTTGHTSEVVIYDYFNPSIHMVLKRKGYQFEELGLAFDEVLV